MERRRASETMALASRNSRLCSGLLLRTLTALTITCFVLAEATWFRHRTRVAEMPSAWSRTAFLWSSLAALATVRTQRHRTDSSEDIRLSQRDAICWIPRCAGSRICMGSILSV